MLGDDVAEFFQLEQTKPSSKLLDSTVRVNRKRVKNAGISASGPFGRLACARTHCNAKGSGEPTCVGGLLCNGRDDAREGNRDLGSRLRKTSKRVTRSLNGCLAHLWRDQVIRFAHAAASTTSMNCLASCLRVSNCP